MMKIIKYITVAVLALGTAACNSSEKIEVTLPEVSFDYEGDVCTLQKGDTETITVQVTDADDPAYEWILGDRSVGNGLYYRFTADNTGTHYLTFRVEARNGSAEQTLKIEVFWPAPTVYEYLPAPGQFINEGYTATDMDAACEYAQSRLARNEYVSLGGFGGYIVMGTGESIRATGSEYDFAILGNSFDGSSEPGIVWVMRDGNGNGEPDDTWYELRGSETGGEGTRQDYRVTYFRPATTTGTIDWEDSEGETGTIERISIHTQSYWPAWVAQESYTLTGTRLEARNRVEGEEWNNGSYGWGYADNYEVDGHEETEKPGANYFRISDAITPEGVALDRIDFVKVQTGVNAKSGGLGEISTEVLGLIDLNKE